MGAAAWVCSGSMSAARAERDAEGRGCRALRLAQQAQQAQAGVFRQSEAGDGLAYDAAVTGHADMGFSCRWPGGAREGGQNAPGCSGPFALRVRLFDDLVLDRFVAANEAGFAYSPQDDHHEITVAHFAFNANWCVVVFVGGVWIFGCASVSCAWLALPFLGFFVHWQRLCGACVELCLFFNRRRVSL